MDRRQFVVGVATGFAGSCAGCASSETESADAEFSLRLFRVTDDEIRTVFAAPTGRFSNEAWNVVSSALDGTTRTYGHTPVDDGQFVEYEGEFYRIDAEATGEATNERPVLDGEVLDGETAERKAVEFSAYPSADGQAVRHAARRAVSGPGETDREFYVLRGSDSEDSALLPEPEYEYVTYGDQTVRLNVTRRRVTETEYTYTATKVADSGTAFRRYVREQVVTLRLDRAKLSGEQRAILREADETREYAESGDLTDAYRGLLERIFGDLPADSTGSRFEYGSRLYRAQLVVSEP